MITQRRILQVFVGLADTLVAEFDVIDFLHTLAATTVEVLDADAAGLMLADQRGELHLLAASSGGDAHPGVVRTTAPAGPVP